MLKKILNTNDNFKRLPHNVKKITMKADGSKFIVQLHCEDMMPVTIGRYDTREEAHGAIAQLSELTNRKINK